ncbi:MAG TPA: hypothetical protein VM600_05165 [Actinomycetota bacterium]|nr:hypothetical protein [Actinomycetota bacterium]
MKRWVFPLVAAVFALLSAVPAAAQDKPTEEDAVRSEGRFNIANVTLSARGEPVKAAPPDETILLTVEVFNAGPKVAKDVTGKLESPGHARIVDATGKFGDIGVEKTATAEFSFVIDKATCEETSEFVVTVRTDDEEQALWLPVAAACPGPRLYNNDVRYEGGDGDGIPEPGETLKVFVMLHNAGRDAASNVRATLTIRSGKVTVLDGTASWPNIDPGVGEFATSPFVIKIADDAEVTEGCDYDGGIVVEDGGVPVEDRRDDPVSSGHGSGTGADPVDVPAGDGNVSSGGGSTGSSGATTTSSGSIEPDKSAGDDPVPEERGEPGTKTDPSAQFEGALAIKTLQGPFEAFFGTMIVCAMTAEDGGPRLAGGGDESAKTAMDLDGAEPTGSGSRSAAAALATVMAVAAAAMVVRYRGGFSAAR